MAPRTKKARRAPARGKSRRRVSAADAVEPPSQPGDSATAPNVIDNARHRFPWPANPAQRYGVESPYLAVVNARGPWAVWRHGAANPPFIPLCTDLLGKEFWRRADNDQRVFAVTVWLRAAQEDDWGIVWGDPVRLCLQWGLDSATFAARLEWLIGAGLACYLTAAEVEAVRSWRPVRRRDSRGGNTRGGQEQAESSRVKQGQAEQDQDPAGPAVSQISSPSASALQIPDSAPKGQGQAEQVKPEHKPSTASKSQVKPEHSAQAQPEAREPANLPKSDHGAGNGSPRTTEGVRNPQHNARPRSVPRARSQAHGGDPTPLGDALDWCNPRAVEFGRAIYEAITGHAPPQDLQATDAKIAGDVGVWVHYWCREVVPSLDPGRWSEFEARCFRDIAKKRKCRGIRDLGAVARAKIVPGILASMMAEGGGHG